MERLLLTMAIAAAGGLIGNRTKFPAGAMLGAMLSTAVFNIICGTAYMPQDLRLVARIITGSLIGAGITKKDVQELKTVLISAIILVFSIIVLSPCLGFMIYKWGNIDITTAVFAAAPGGMSDMSLISDEFGADSAKVALMQLIRILSVVNLFPIIIRFINNKKSKRRKHAAPELIPETNGHPVQGPRDGLQHESKNGSQHGSRIRLLYTFLVGAAGGFIGQILKIPAGAMICSMLLVAAFNILSHKAYFPSKLKAVAKILVGGVIGSGITMDDVLGLKSIILPVLILVFGLILLNILIGFILHKVTKMDLLTALLSSAPGGMTEMTLVGQDMGADSPKIAILQLIRLVSVIATFPILLQILLKSFQ